MPYHKINIPKGGNLNYNQLYIDFDIHDNSFDNLDIANFYKKRFRL